MGQCRLPFSRRRFPLLTRLLQWGPASAQLGSLAYPPEIIVVMAEFLDNVSLLSLAPTCRFLYQTCLPHQMPKLEPAERQQLLCGIEKDTPSLVYCYIYDKLHRWKWHWFRQFSSHRQGPYCYLTAYRSLSEEDHGYYSIPCLHASVVMNQHFLFARARRACRQPER
jgi:hypothetical protein